MIARARSLSVLCTGLAVSLAAALLGVPLLVQARSADLRPECAMPLYSVPPAGERASADPPPPCVAVRVRVPASVGVGQELTYRLIVENQSAAAAHHVILRNPLPAHARFVRAQPEPSAQEPELLWQLGTLAGGARREVTLVVVPDGKGDIRNCARVQYEHGQCVTTKVARPGISLRQSGPAQALLYDSVTFQLVVTNTGPTALTNVAVTDILAPGLEHALGNRIKWDLGTLAPGQVRRVEFQAIAKQAGRLRAAATVTADGGLRDEAENTLIITEPRLGVRIIGPAQRYVNTSTPYQITVTNEGAAALANVALALPLPAQVAVVSLTQGGQSAGNQVNWSVGALAPGASRSVDVVLRAQTPAQHRFEATALAERGLKARDVVTTTFAGVPAVTLDVTVSDDPVEVGGQTRYRIAVRNPGTQPVTQLRVVAILPEQLAAVRASGPADNKKEGPKIVFEPLTLQPASEGRYEILTKALKPGDLRVRVEITAEQLTAGSVFQEVSTTIYQDVR